MYLEALVQMSILQKAVAVPGFFLSFSKETNTLLYARNSQKKKKYGNDSGIFKTI